MSTRRLGSPGVNKLARFVWVRSFDSLSVEAWFVEVEGVLNSLASVRPLFPLSGRLRPASGSRFA